VSHSYFAERAPRTTLQQCPDEIRWVRAHFLATRANLPANNSASNVVTNVGGTPGLPDRIIARTPATVHFPT